MPSSSLSGGVEIKGLLSGGAHVVVTTSRYSRATVEYYREFSSVSTAVAPLILVHSNQGSKPDVEAFVDYIYTILRLNLDYVIPFAAVPENGREIDGLRQV